MKVHITSTSDVDPTVVKEVIKTLSYINGPIHFKSLSRISNSDLENVIYPFVNLQPLEFDLFFTICENYRARKVISREDYVVVFTSLRNQKFWLSSFDNAHNIFIDINEWKYLTSTPLKYALSYQVVGNLFHSLIGIDSSNFVHDPIAHNKSIGCISDFCNDISEVLLKFRTGYICENCLNRFYSQVEDKLIIKQIYSIIQELRKEFVQFQFEETIDKPLHLSIDDKLRLYIGGNEIELEPLNKALYYFFLLNPNGLKSNDIIKTDSINKLSSIYKFLKVGIKDKEVQLKSIHKLCNTNENQSSSKKSSFAETKSRINKILIKKIDASINKQYTINNTEDKNKKKSTFKIELQTEYISIDPLLNLTRTN